MMNRRKFGFLGFWMLVGGYFLVGSAMACPASTVLLEADRARETALHDKATRVADKYMEQKGIDSTSSEADIIRPYVVGTSLVDHGVAKQGILFRHPHSLDKPIDDCVRDSIDCWHHSEHFGDGKRKADQLPRESQQLGG